MAAAEVEAAETTSTVETARFPFDDDDKGNDGIGVVVRVIIRATMEQKRKEGVVVIDESHDNINNNYNACDVFVDDNEYGDNDDHDYDDIIIINVELPQLAVPH